MLLRCATLIIITHINVSPSQAERVRARLCVSVSCLRVRTNGMRPKSDQNEITCTENCNYIRCASPSIWRTRKTNKKHMHKCICYTIHDCVCVCARSFDNDREAPEKKINRTCTEHEVITRRVALDAGFGCGVQHRLQYDVHIFHHHKQSVRV